MSAPNYKESDVTGTQWTRCTRVVIENPYGGAPSIIFVEENAIQLGEKVITQPSGNLFTPFNPTDEIPLLDDNGVDTLETFNHLQVYQMLNSLYMYLAAQRDYVPPAEPEVPPVTP